MEVLEKITIIIDDIEAHNGKAYLVGGFVRDYLLGRVSFDYDLEVYYLDYDVLVNILTKYGSVLRIGNFGALKLEGLNLEITMPRLENKIGNRHTDFAITVDKNLPPQEAVLRRDFTVNALLYDLKSNQILDYTSGVLDLNNKVLRHVSNKFIEDPLRVLRAIRFVSELNFTIDSETLLICEKLQEELQYLSIERISSEFKKILLGEYFIHATKYFYLLETLFVFEESSHLNMNNFSSQENMLLFRYYHLFKNQPEKLSLFITKKKLRKKLTKLFNSSYQYDAKSLLSLYESNLDAELLAMFFSGDIEKNIRFLKKIFLHLDNISIKYNGNYFLKKGFLGKEISVAKRKILSSEIEKFLK